ncbi:hypothetical protein E2C01_060407 [Portunus trituberculatus]|uniref:Uncharacterized protein n=1 Tax=Portunus trituberculatus TaxID=210409 RepID=A0A5B7H2E4_PORTR|nr:hypothetical protein [Portunus trituberculatus]
MRLTWDKGFRAKAVELDGVVAPFIPFPPPSSSRLQHRHPFSYPFPPPPPPPLPTNRGRQLNLISSYSTTRLRWNGCEER